MAAAQLANERLEPSTLKKCRGGLKQFAEIYESKGLPNPLQ